MSDSEYLPESDHDIASSDEETEDVVVEDNSSSDGSNEEEETVDPEVTAAEIKKSIRQSIIKTLIKDYEMESKKQGILFDYKKYLNHLESESGKIDDPTGQDDPLMKLMASSISQNIVVDLVKQLRKVKKEDVVDFLKSQMDMEDVEESEEEATKESSDDDDDQDFQPRAGKNFIMMFGSGMGKRGNSRLDKDKYDEKDQEFVDMLEKEKSKYNENATLDYFSKLDAESKDSMLKMVKTVQEMDNSLKPLFFKIMESKMDMNTKAYAFKRLNELENLNPHTDDFYKTKTLLEGLIKIPFGIYKTVESIEPTERKKVRKFMRKVDKKMAKHVYGHDKTKERIKQIIAKWISNPDSRGNVLGLCGPPGTGKTELLRTLGEKILERPFHLISLGGATDSSFLEGHDYTYVGSKWGRIVECMLKSDCMNPVFFFDELDKVGTNWRGDEIMNFLIHLTDPVQNDKFHDKYFGDLDIDLSKALFVFSFNHKRKVDPILRDRMEIIDVEGYKVAEKMEIVKKHLLPRICKDIGFPKENLDMSDEILEYLINSYTFEGGVRRIKEHLTNIVMDLNKRAISKGIDIPYKLTKEEITTVFLKGRRPNVQKMINSHPQVGVVNELCAITISGCSSGLGEVTPAITTYAPSKDKYDLIMTGNLGKMCKEVLIVAKSLLWNLIPDEEHETVFKRWKHSAIHYHAPDIAVSKDGPSAGVANVVGMVSLVCDIPVRNDIALTGEVSVDGKVTEIGGLREKAGAAKRAGCKLVLCPYDNYRNYKEILNDKHSIIDDTFNIQPIKTVWEALDIMLVNNDQKFNRFGAGLYEDEESAVDPRKTKRVRVI